MVILFLNSFNSWGTTYTFAKDFNFDTDGCLNWDYQIECDDTYEKLITNWLIVAAFIYFLCILRRLSILILWRYKHDPHK